MFQGKLTDPGIPDGSLLSTEPDIRMGCIGRIGSTNFKVAGQELKASRANWECLPMVDEISERKAKIFTQEGYPIPGVNQFLPSWQVYNNPADLGFKWHRA